MYSSCSIYNICIYICSGGGGGGESLPLEVVPDARGTGSSTAELHSSRICGKGKGKGKKEGKGVSKSGVGAKRAYREKGVKIAKKLGGGGGGGRVSKSLWSEF